ncbi:MAG: bifunctional oligoribonuclease/PAP phosphatase NrnA [Ktedonobacteraceae bacterium]
MSTTTTSSVSLSLQPQINPLLLQQAMTLIEPAQRIALLAHEHPDGDCLGSALGFTLILEEMGKSCAPVCADPAPKSFTFIPGIERLQQSLGPVGEEPFDLVIALDAGELARYGVLYERHHEFLDIVTILNIDHHVSSQGCGRVNIIDPTAASTTELLVLFQQQAQLPLTRDAAQCLLTGLITDTSSFQFTSTTPRTMEAGAVLLGAGAIAETIVGPIYRSKSLAHVRLQAKVVESIETAYDGRLIWSYATEETLAATGATPEMDDNFSGFLRDVEGVQIAAFFKSYGETNVTRLSLRSAAPYSAAEICLSLGGGGHARAAGATIHRPLKEAIPMVVALLKQAVESTPT